MKTNHIFGSATIAFENIQFTTIDSFSWTLQALTRSNEQSSHHSPSSFFAMTPIYKDGNYNLNIQKLYFLGLYSGAADLCLVSWRAIKPTTVPDYGLVLANKAGQLSPTAAKQCYNAHKHASVTHSQ